MKKTPNVKDLLAKLERLRDALGDGRNATSEHERTAYRQTSTSLQATISGLRNAPSDLARQSERLAEWEARRKTWLEKEASITQQIADAPDPHTFANSRERDQELDRQEHLKAQRQRLHDGSLLLGPGVTSGTLGAIDARIAELTERRDRAQAALDAALREAEMLLAEAVTS